MKINQKILSIPPYISTSWKNVISLHFDQGVLVIGLVNGSSIEIPGLDKEILKATFAAHEKFLEQESPHSKVLPPGAILSSSIMEDPSTAILNLPLRFGFEANMGNLLQHNPDASDSPDLPKEVIEKIASFSKAIGLESLDPFPKPEPHCNCMHCQVLKAMQKKEEQEHEHEEEEISEEDLRFREWDIEQIGNNLFTISNPLNTEEQYNIFLGDPVGCTCGEPNCEHIRAVLNS